MKRKKCLFVGAVVLILLFSASNSLAQIKKNKIVQHSKGAELDITTDKTFFQIGEMVEIFFLNIGDATLYGGGPIVTIYNYEDEIIYQEACYCYWEIEPGEFMEWSPWDQTNKNGEQVPVGEYTVEGFLSGNQENYVDTTTIYIVDFNPPDSPYGPTKGVVNISYNFCIDIPDKEEFDPCYLIWDFGDGYVTAPVGPYPAGKTVCKEHLFSEPGDYEIKVGIKDIYGSWYWTDPLIVNIRNNSPPSTPKIEGPPKNRQLTYGNPVFEYDYKFMSEDPDGDDILYIIDWGDGSYNDWFGPNPSGEWVTVKHTWDKKGCYTIQAKAKDIWGAESNWSKMSIPIFGSRLLYIPFFNLLQNYPILLLIINSLL
jgi:hypothetical protein